VEFGDQWEGAVLVHEFELEVRGEGELVVHSVKADCGCTATEVARLEGERRVAYAYGDPLPAGSRLALVVRFDTRNKSGPSTRKVQVFSSQETGVTTVEVVADIHPWLEVKPPAPIFHKVRDGEPFKTRLSVNATTGDPFLLSHRREGVPDLLQVTPLPIAPDDAGRASRWLVDLVLAPGLSRANHAYPIHLETDVELKTTAGEPTGVRFSVSPYVTFQVQGPVSVEPPLMSFGVVSPAETIARTVRVASTTGDALGEPSVRLEPISAEEPLTIAETARLSVRPAGPSAWDVELLLEGLPEDAGSRFVAKVVIDPGLEGEPPIDVNVAGFLKQAVAPIRDGGDGGDGGAPAADAHAGHEHP